MLNQSVYSGSQSNHWREGIQRAIRHYLRIKKAQVKQQTKNKSNIPAGKHFLCVTILHPRGQTEVSIAISASATWELRTPRFFLTIKLINYIYIKINTDSSSLNL
jgi:hypothetical protein